MRKAKPRRKAKRVSIRDQLRAAKTASEYEISADPIGSLKEEWFKKAEEANTWKPKWECMMILMGYCCGDPFGNAPLPQKFDNNNKAREVITIFAKWLNDENHIFTRQHILKLLIPFGNSFGKTHWKKANKIAEGLILKQWMEKKRGFLPLVTPALISVYIASGSQLKKWKAFLIQSMGYPQGQVRMSCWDFLAKICILSKQNDILKKRGRKDVELFINDEIIIQYLKNTILNDKEKDVRDSCAQFIYAAKQICNKVGILELAYKEILNDKRASMALDVAADLFNNDTKILSEEKSNDVPISKKKAINKESRKNNMRAMIAKARKEALAAQLEAGYGDKGAERKKMRKKSRNDDETDSDSDSDEDDETERERERQKMKRIRERERKQREKERERLRKRKERIKCEIKQREIKYDVSDSESDESDSEEEIKRFKSEIIFLDGKMNEFMRTYTQRKLLFLHENMTEALDVKEELEQLELTNNSFSKKLQDISSYVQSLKVPNILNYEEWDINMIMIWIKTLDNGKYKKYCHILRRGFLNDGIEDGEALLAMDDQKDLRNEPFGLKSLPDRKALIKHFQSLPTLKNQLINNIEDNNDKMDNEGAPTAYL